MGVGGPIPSLLKSELESGLQAPLIHCPLKIKPQQPLGLPPRPCVPPLCAPCSGNICFGSAGCISACKEEPFDQPRKAFLPSSGSCPCPCLTPEMLLSLLCHLQRASIKTPCACRDLITDYLCCLPVPSAPHRQSQPPAGEKESIHDDVAALPPRRGQPPRSRD